MDIKKELITAYTLLPPPLAALPAKYHAPISLLIHSLSTGVLADELARLAELEDYRELAFFLGLTHDIHQKLVEDGLATLKTSKKYIREKLDKLGKLEYYKYIENALESDACGKGSPVKGLPIELPLICHISDMAQGSLEGLNLVYWLNSMLEKIHPDLVVRYYSIMIPQVFARSYIMHRIYENHIKKTDHVALASPWGMYVITYEDELPEIIEISWDELRIDNTLTPVPYEDIKKVEKTKKSATINKIKISGDESKNKLWSRFARLFYNRESLGNDTPLYPTFPEDLAGLFINIRFTDVEFSNISQEDTHKCALCGMSHLAEHSIVANMFGKIAGASVTLEKWNRFMPANIKVKAWDTQGQWRNKIGLCPLCVLEAVGIRYSGFTGKLSSVLTVTMSKPIPVGLMSILGRIIAESRNLEKPIVSEGKLERVVLDYSSATIGTQEDSEPTINNMFLHKVKRGRKVITVEGVLLRIGKLISWGIYPVKFLPSTDANVVDRPLIAPCNFPIVDFPVTSQKYGRFLPWIGPLLATAGIMDRSEALQYLEFRPEHAPLALLTLDKSSYDSVREILSSVGV